MAKSSTSSEGSPTVNLTREYATALEYAKAYEVDQWDAKAYEYAKACEVDQWESDETNHQQQFLLAQLLKPNRECVQEALRLARTPTFTRLVSTYCDHSEKACHLLLRLHHRVHLARSIYAPIHDLLDTLPGEVNSTQFPCDQACEVFLQFHRSENPFPSPESDKFHGMRLCFHEIKQQVDQCLQKSRVRVGRTTSSITVCLTAHALLSLAATSMLPALLPLKLSKKEIGKREVDDMAKLDNTRKSAYVINNDLDTIHRIVSRLYDTIEMDKCLIRLVLDSGRGKEPIYEVGKQLRKDRLHVLGQLTDLEEYIYLCFAGINRARSLLFRGFHLQQTYFNYMTQ